MGEKNDGIGGGLRRVRVTRLGNIKRLSSMRLGDSLLAGFLGLAVLTGCATVPPKGTPAYQNYVERDDPLEPMNRYFFEVNRGLDELVLKPASAAYNAALPDPVQNSIRAFLNNLHTPVILANDLLQGDGDRAYITFSRFMVNTTIGLLGVFDVASEIGLQYHDDDFGQTLAVAGMRSGPYLMIPLLGPSNPRDLLGYVVDFAFDPLTFLAPSNVRLGRTAVDTVDNRNRNRDVIKALQEGSVDFYTTVRDAFRQNREDQIRNKRATPGETSPGVILDLDIKP
jgi:phospholipid-binding lipoprotein MlaA